MTPFSVRGPLVLCLLAAPAAAADRFEFRELPAPAEGHIDSVAFAPDGERVAAGAGGVIAVWELPAGKPGTRMRLPEPQTYHRLVFTADGAKLVSDGREDPMVRVWDVKTGKQAHEWPHPLPKGQ